MNPRPVITNSIRAIESLAPAVCELGRITTELEDIARATARGHFTPDEDERVRVRFAEYLAARAGLLQTIEDLKPIALSSRSDMDDGDRLRAFTISYAATALLVRAGRFIVERYAPNKVVQRKLNEAEPRYGIPRKQFTSIYRALTNPINAWQIHDAIKFADAHREEIESLASDIEMCRVVEYLHDAEESIRMSKRNYARAYLRYRWHAWRRRRASAVGQAMFGMCEMAGRIIAELHNPWHDKRITAEKREQIAQLLQPGDVLISRHDDAASNFFLPGFWVHASLHVGDEQSRRRLNVNIDADRESRWIDPNRVLEAKKDGVRFRPLYETLAVDAVAVLRPRLQTAEIAQAISQAILHEGKLYDFEFDFFRSDRLVCTEVVYRGFHGVGGIEFQLSRRAGRPTLAAEDLLAMAMRDCGFEPVAVFGAPGADDRIVSGPKTRDVLATSCRLGEHA